MKNGDLPDGKSVMEQSWDKLLFLHWRVPVEDIRCKIPAALDIDTFDGSAWIGITPFTMPAFRPPHLPAIPLIMQTHEVNVRTYVRGNGEPGVWFFSLDANNPLAVIGARLGLGLPYFQASMQLRENNGTVHFTSHRMHPGALQADLSLEWRTEGETFFARPDGLTAFLTERYCLYGEWHHRLYRIQIKHSPWALQTARLMSFSSTMIEAAGFRTPEDPPRLYAQAIRREVAIYFPEKLR